MESYKINLISKTLTITKAFEDAASNVNSEEYKLYQKLTNEIPDLKIVRKTHRTPSKYKTKNGEEFRCNQFKNLTYDNMEKFIDALPNNSEYKTQFKFAKTAAAAVQTNGYAVVRRWFSAQFPEFRKNPTFYLYNQPKLIYFKDILEQNNEEESEKKAS